MRWYQRLFRRARTERQLDAELRFHLEQQVSDYVATGMTPEEARRRARLEFGGLDQVKEECRDVGAARFVETLIQDIRYGLRQLRRNPGFTAVAVVTLALGIGANTAIFTAVNGILFQPLPYSDASRLVSITGYKSFAGGIMGTLDFSPSVWKQVEAQTPAIEEMALYQDKTNLTLTGGAVPEVVPGVHVSGDFFTLLGTRPLLGRPIVTSDTRPGAKPAVVVSYALWHANWGDDPGVVGRSVVLDGDRYTVIAVMPPGFEFPLYSGPKGVWLPLVKSPAQELDAMAVARIKNDATIDGVNAQLKTVSRRLSADFYGYFGKSGSFLATALKPGFSDLDNAILILLGAVGFVLLIACVNVSGLLLARGWARQREVATREALGASRWRIIRQFLTESVLLAFAGGALGTLFSILCVCILRVITPPNAPEYGHFQLDTNVLWFALGVSLVTGILFGLAPAIHASARRIGTALKENLGGSPGGFSSTRTRHLRSALAVVEVALAVILVVGAMLAARSLENLAAVRLGLRTDHILTMRANFSPSVCGPGRSKELAACNLTVGGALSEIRALPGVEDAAVASTLPLESWSVASYLSVEGQKRELSLASGSVIAVRLVSPGYFRALEIRLLSGRGFASSDTPGEVHVAIVNQKFVRNYFGGHPLGQRISYKDDRAGHPEWLEIVGVVSNARDVQPRQAPRAEIYVPFEQAAYFQAANYIVRTAANPVLMASQVKRAIWSVDKEAPITDIATMDQLVAAHLAKPRFQTVLLASFGGLGLILAMVGIYGVISYGVTQRRHEIGVRMALGAERKDVLRMVIGEGTILAGVGIAIGIVGAMALTRFLRSLLFEIKPTDPVTFAAVAILVASAALAACYIPARRAANLDPMAALRHE